MLPIAMEKRHVLNSWKEIADYMGRGVRTVQRYERDLRLPIHRPAGKSRSAVIAFADEIELWMRKGPLRSLTNGHALKHAETNVAEWHRLVANSEMLVKRADTLKRQMAELLRLMQDAERRRQEMRSDGSSHRLSTVLTKSDEVLKTKMNELAELVTQGGQLSSSIMPFPQSGKSTDRQNIAVEKH